MNATMSSKSWIEHPWFPFLVESSSRGPVLVKSTFFISRVDEYVVTYIPNKSLVHLV